MSKAELQAYRPKGLSELFQSHENLGKIGKYLKKTEKTMLNSIEYDDNGDDVVNHENGDNQIKTTLSTVRRSQNVNKLYYGSLFGGPDTGQRLLQIKKRSRQFLRKLYDPRK